MCNSCCNSCGNGTNFTMPVFGNLRVNDNCVTLQLRSTSGWNGYGCSWNTSGTSANGNASGCDYGYFGCCNRRRSSTFVGTTSSDGETNFYVNRCGSSGTYGSGASRCGCCYNG